MEILIGTISGIISGTGMGGGTVLIFLLGQILGIEHHIAQAANLAIIVNIKNKNIDLKLAIQISIIGILGAIIGAKTAVYTNVNSLKKYFGFFLLIIAIREIYILFKNHKKSSIEKS